MADEGKKECSITWSVGKRICTLTIDAGYLVEEWKDRADAARRHWHLKRLSPMIDYSQGRDKYCRSYWCGTVIILGIAVSLFFSSLSSHIPLLAPFIGLIGLYLLYNTVRHSKVKKWTIFQKDDGSGATYITHGGCSEEEIEKFTRCFVEAVKNAKVRYKDNQSLESVAD